jgi:hypothetical protein
MVSDHIDLFILQFLANHDYLFDVYLSVCLRVSRSIADKHRAVQSMRRVTLSPCHPYLRQEDSHLIELTHDHSSV